jgi:hypothetical protein
VYKARGGDSTRYSTHLNGNSNVPIKTLEGLRRQPLTSEHYYPHADAHDGGAVDLGGAALGVDTSAILGAPSLGSWVYKGWDGRSIPT